MSLLYTSNEWNMDDLKRIWDRIDTIGKEKYGFDYYEAEFQIVSYEQMLDAYSTHGMPVYYNHWSFGKSFLQHKQSYKAGHSGLAYEIVINTSPSIAFLMDSNSTTMQALVMAHASVGHSTVFKTNYMFRDWTDAEGILDYLAYAKAFVEKCDRLYDPIEVERTLDFAHSVQFNSLDVGKRHKPKTEEDIQARLKSQMDNLEKIHNPIYSQEYEKRRLLRKAGQEQSKLVHCSENNFLLFLEMYAPKLQPWQRELFAIVRNMAQYWYPQLQTQLLNEGAATFVHYNIMTDLYEEGSISAGHYLEFLTSHTGVTMQRPFNSPHYSGINVYALGFAMFRDIKRICLEPTAEDKEYFPQLIGADWIEVTKDIIANYRDESFVSQWLSPQVIRDFSLFSIHDNRNTYEDYVISGIHNKEDYGIIKEKLSKQYDFQSKIPQLNIHYLKTNNTASEVMLVYKGTNDKKLDYTNIEDILDPMQEYLMQEEGIIVVSSPEEADDFFVNRLRSLI